jgi:small-conductance mechanosensitive channel
VIYEMTWRTAQIRNANLDLITIPNSVLAQATVVNRSRPNRWTEITVTFEVGTSVSAGLVETTVMNAIEPLIGDVLVKDRKPNLRAAAIKDGDIHYRLNVYGVLGPNSERPIQDKVVRALRDAFETAGITFSSTSATVLQIIAGAKPEK